MSMAALAEKVFTESRSPPKRKVRTRDPAAATAMREEVRAKVMPIVDARERLLALIDALFACFDANRDLLRIHATGTQARMARLGPRSWHQDPDALLLRIGSFEAGLA